MQVFVPLSDELLYQSPFCLPCHLRPYQVGMICVEWLDVETIVLDESSCPNAGVEDTFHAG